MAVLLSDNRQAYGILSVIFIGFVAVGAGGTGGVAIWLCRGAGMPIQLAASAYVWTWLYHHGARYP